MTAKEDILLIKMISFIKNGHKETLYAFIVIHGTPGEDGNYKAI